MSCFFNSSSLASGLSLLENLRTSWPLASRISSVTRRQAEAEVIEDGPVGRVGGEGLVGRKRRIGVGVALDADSRSRREKMRFAGGQIFNFAQCGDVVENPEGASVGADDEIVVVNREIAHGGVRQIELQRLPMVAVVERNPNGIFGSGEQQSFADGIFADGVDGAEVGKAVVIKVQFLPPSCVR